MEFAKLNLRHRRLKISNLDALNDPFEFFCFDTSKSDFRTKLKSGHRAIANDVGVVCFSKAWNCPVQWAHYADRHRGICLGFSYPKEFANNFHEVEYSTSKFDANSLNVKQILDKALYTKYKNWEYEQEVRTVIELKERDSDGNYYMPFEGNLNLEKVIVGCNCEISRSELDKLIGDLKSKIEVFKVRPAFRTFKMVRNENKRLWK
ncbi:hypothetical protein WH43_07015 [Rheinheimera sp. KL1]|uniref:DUF2971 domain-containing protein n=1 Tax=Rheinheimera sp. KL1 TaxID=1635005 RepID=UPI0006A9E9C1|nr:DUF2971 domain-containing protein [Rheinheimera sp. KL1]KOO58948.1 hypothetical protein WH43_07015 [Rheinheimera sp. KL1]